MKYDFFQNDSIVRGLALLCLSGLAGFALAACSGGSGPCSSGEKEVTYNGETSCRSTCESNSDCETGTQCDEQNGVCLPVDGNGGDQDAGTTDSGGDDIGFPGNGDDGGTTDGGGGGAYTCSESPDVETDCFQAFQCIQVFRQNQSCALAAQNSLTEEGSTNFEDFNSCLENSCSDACSQGSEQGACTDCINSNCRGESGGSCETDQDCGSDYPDCYEGTCVAQDGPADYCVPQYVAQESGYGCGRVGVCIQNCGQDDQECQQTCAENAAEGAVSEYQTFVQCVLGECPEQSQSCVQQALQPGGACSQQFYTCYNCPQPTQN